MQTSRALLGFTGDDSIRYVQEKRAPPALPSGNNVSLGDHSIQGTVKNREGDPVSGVLVRLQMIVPQDSAYSEAVREVAHQKVERSAAIRRVYVLDSINHQQLISLSAYSRTDASGKFSFSRLPGNKAFEVLPLQPGYQFGPSKGMQ